MLVNAINIYTKINKSKWNQRLQPCFTAGFINSLFAVYIIPGYLKSFEMVT